MAAGQGVSATALPGGGPVDLLDPQRPDPPTQPPPSARLGAVIAEELFLLLGQDTADGQGRRRNGYRRLSR